MLIFFIFLFNLAREVSTSGADSLPTSYLIKVDLPERADIYRLDSLGVPILQDMNSYVLADAPYKVAKLLRRNKFSLQVLDKNPKDKEYYLVFLVAEKDTEPLKAFGKILLSDTNFVLLRAVNKEGLFRGRWELKRLRKSPIKIKPPEQKRFGELKDPVIDEIVGAVEWDSIKANTQRLQDFVTRYSFTDSCAAASQWIYNKFNSFGIDSVFYHVFEPESGYAPNVVATMVGSETPQRVFVICGHYDCTSESPEILAPGADDNASGTVAAIEAARILSNYQFKSTVRFIAFCGEEQGLIGSQYYAGECSSNGDSILGVFNCDMIGYTEMSNTVVVVTNTPSEWLADFFIACVDSYVTGLGTYKYNDGGGSDHASFWDEGYDAIFTIELEFNPEYHTTGDTLGLLDSVFFTNVVKANVAALASIAGPIPPGVELSEVATCEFLKTHPNPFNQFTVISYQLPEEPTTVSLKIYDLAGRLVKTLLDVSLPTYAKNGKVVWDRKDEYNRAVSSGIYFCQLKAGKTYRIQKIVLLR